MATDIRAALLLHGFTHTGRSWRPVIRAIEHHASYTLLAPDIRGHGSAGEAVPVSLDAVIDDVRAMHRPSLTLVGYSMGGRIALHAALAMPVRRLVLIGASPGIEDPAEREARRVADEQLADEIERSSIEEFAQRWATTTAVLAGQPAMLVEGVVREDRLRNTTAGLARALRGLGTGALPSLWGRLGELTMQVTLVAGERDRKFTDIAARMAQRIDGAEVVTVPGAGHAVHLEAPEAVSEIIAGR